MRFAALYAAAVIALSPALLAANETTWSYTGSVSRVYENTLGVPSPLGQPVRVSLTFDPATPDTTPSPALGTYLPAGGNTSFKIQVGQYVSDPIDRLRIEAITAGGGQDDQYNFLSYDSSSSFIAINFPGFAEDATVAFFFRERRIPGPITSDALPVLPPLPSDFQDVRMVINKRAGGGMVGDIVFSFASLNLQIAVPEPTGMVLMGIGAAGAILVVRRRKLTLPSAH
jgi:hypothetical protein